MSLLKQSYIVDRVVLIRNLIVHGKERAEEQDGDGKSRKELDRLVRLLRPQSPQDADYSHQVYRAVRRTLLNSPAAGSRGPGLQSNFNENFEKLKKLNPAIANPMLMFLKPLMFSTKSAGIFKNAVETECKLDASVSKLDVGIKSTFTNPEMIPPLTSNTTQATRHSLLAHQSEVSLFPPNHPRDTTISSEQLYSLWMTPEIENKLILDLLYILQGTNGTHIRYDVRSELYVIDPKLALVSTARDLILSTCELGWVYKKVDTYIRHILNPKHNQGLVSQALASALQEEIVEYYRLLAVIESEALKFNQHTITSAVTLQEGKESAFQSKKGQKESEKVVVEVGLTLYRLRAWLDEPMDRMVLLARLVDSLGPTSCLTGGAIISRLYAHTRHGDPQYAPLLSTLLTRVSEPFNNMLVGWVLHGELQDPHHEFFVDFTSNRGSTGNTSNRGTTGNPSNKGNPWKDTYTLRKELIPVFLPIELAQKMLNIGRSINYLKLCLHRPALVENRKSGVLGGQRKSFRQINKSKKLTLYGRVVNDDHEDDAKVDFSDEEDDNEHKSRVSEPFAIVKKTSFSSKEKSEQRERFPSSSKPGENNLSKDKDQVLKELFQPIFLDVHPHLALNEALCALRSTHLINDHNHSHHNTQVDKENLQQVVNYSENGPENRKGKTEKKGEFLLSTLIHRLSRAIDTRLLHLLEHRFAINDHLFALKRFLLLGQGDFVLCLMDAIGPELKKRAPQLFRHNLTAMLEGALRQANTQYDPPFILDRVSIRLLEAAPGDSGWEIFSLDYNVSDVPLNSIIHSVAMSQYRVIFHMLWRLKRVEWSLTTTWKQFLNFKNTTSDRHNRNSTFTGVLALLKSVFQRCHLYRAQMMHFVTNLMAFLMFEVLETAWIALQEKLSKATSLDDIILAHDLYLQEIMQRALLTEESEGLNMAIQQLLQTILRFCSLEETLVADAMATSARQKLIMDREGAYARDDEDDRRDADVVPTALVMRIEETARDYTVQLTQLMTMLKEEGEQSSEILRYLIFRLDFNGFFDTTLPSASVG